MEQAQALVHDFHSKYRFARGALKRATMLDRETWLDLGFQRFRLIDEEKGELQTAWHQKDIVEIADALGDLAYVVLGTAVACGIEIGPILREIHRSNMTKEVGQFKPVKGPDYTPPSLRPLLIQQGFTIKEL